MILTPNNEFKVFSFDIFSTLVQRRCGPPNAVWALLEPKVSRLTHGRLKNFQIVRPQVERLVRLPRKDKHGEITFQEIYNQFVALGLATIEEARKIAEAEMALELKVMAPRPIGINLLAEVQAFGQKIILISDMYLPETFILQMLSSLKIEGFSALYL
ncbi:MAG: hypothetical protein ACRCTY_05740, partial [Candidatus Adiutrix sp.]